MDGRHHSAQVYLNLPLLHMSLLLPFFFFFSAFVFTGSYRMGIEFRLDVVTNKIQGEGFHKSLEFCDVDFGHSHYGISALRWESV